MLGAHGGQSVLPGPFNLSMIMWLALANEILADRTQANAWNVPAAVEVSVCAPACCHKENIPWITTGQGRYGNT